MPTPFSEPVPFKTDIPVQENLELSEADLVAMLSEESSFLTVEEPLAQEDMA